MHAAGVGTTGLWERPVGPGVPRWPCHPLLAVCGLSPPSQAVDESGVQWPLFTVNVSTLAHKGESQALLSAPQDARPHNCLQLQTAPALGPGFRQEPEPTPFP